MEARAVKQLLEDGVGDEGEEVSLLHAGHPPIMIRGEDGVLYQVGVRKIQCDLLAVTKRS